MKRICLLIYLIAVTLTGIGQSLEFDYFGLASPGDEIELFAPDIISLKNSKETSIAISSNGDEIFFSGGQGWPECKIMHMRKINNEWSKPKVANFSTDCYSTEPAFSPDGKYLYYSSSKGMKDIKQYCIWRVEKAGNEWGEPEKVIDTANPAIWEFHPSITKDGTVYFCSWDSLKQVGNIYKSKYANEVHLEPERVNFPFNIQSSDVNPFIDPDEEYIIISSTGQEGKGGYDVYISYRKEDDSWSAPINFGDKFNTMGDDESFDVSPDGRFLFIYKQDDVYWTETKGVFESLKKDSAN
jgi:WD40-like Beta Propeller Repeat.